MNESQARKRPHKHKHLVRLSLGQPRGCPRDKDDPGPVPTHFLPGTRPVCPWYKRRVLLLILHSGSPACPLGQARFFPGTNRGRTVAEKSLCVKRLCAFVAPRDGKASALRIASQRGIRVLLWCSKLVGTGPIPWVGAIRQPVDPVVGDPVRQDSDKI